MVNSSQVGTPSSENNPAFSYPVFLNGQECPPSAVRQCKPGGSVAHPCCAALARGAKPWATVPSNVLLVMIILIPSFIFTLRHFILQRSVEHPDVTTKDAFLGYAFTTTFAFATTNVIKLSVAMPRPNHYSLMAVAAYVKNDHYAFDSRKSFPSGHSSLSMATMLYTTLVLLHDIKTRTCPFVRHARFFFITLAMIPVGISIFVAVTRVINYWHSTTDVLAGLCLGVLWGIVGHHHAVPGYEVLSVASPDRPKHV